MISLAGIAAASAAQASVPAAQPRGVAAAFGNTVKALYPDGKDQRIWLKEDGTWEARGKTGRRTSGRWTQNGEKVCLRQTRPLPIPFSYCTPFPADGGVGAVWAGHDMKGEPIRLTVVPGIQ